MTIGAVLAGELMSRGRRKAVLIANSIGIVGSLLSVILNYDIMFVGRLLFGICAGLNMAICPKMIEETIPTRLMDKGFGICTAIGTNLTVFISLLSDKA
jgi:MFS family permease